MRGGATFSGDHRYRYTLTRTFREYETLAWSHHVIFIMLNPSTANAEIADPTVRRCITYARDWGYHGLVVLNLFALRATDPKALYSADDPIGDFNDAAIRGCLKNYRERQISFGKIYWHPANVIAAWGEHGSYLNRAEQVIKILQEEAQPVSVLRLNKGGQPAHPLYLPRNLVPIPYL